MPEERTLVANLVPQIADADLQKFVNDLNSSLTSVFTVDTKMTPTGAPNTSAPANTTSAQDAREDEGESSPKTRRITEAISNVKSSITNTFDNFKINPGELMMGAFGAVMMIFDILKKAWDMIFNASPLLSNVINMFSSLLNIILGPIGTAIGMELIPILKNTYERVMTGVRAIWQAYEEGGLKGMIQETFRVLGDVFLPLIQELWEVGSVILDAVIGAVLDSIFGEGTWDSVKEAILTVAKWIEDIGNFLHSIFGGFMGNGKTISENISEMTAWERLATGGRYGGPTGGINLLMDMLSQGFAEGGAIDPVPGGRMVRVGEGGEREWIVPQSKVSSFIQSQSSTVGGNTYYISVNGYTDTDLTEKIVNAIDRRTDMNRLMGGF